MKKKGIFLVLMLAMLMGLGLTANAAPVTMPDGTVFDAEYYAAANPDVVAVFGNDATALYAHYANFGKKEGRPPVAGSGNTTTTVTDNTGFDAAYYAAKYPDVVAALGNNPAVLKNHYDSNGKKEGRFANAAEEKAAAAVVTTTNSATASDYEMEVLNIVNQYRKQNGLGTLAWDDGLGAAADVRAKEIVSVFSHTRPDNSSCFTAFPPANNYKGENIAAGQINPADVMNSWMNSPGHRANILSPNFTKLGVGYYQGGGTYGSYWTQCFSS